MRAALNPSKVKTSDPILSDFRRICAAARLEVDPRLDIDYSTKNPIVG